MIDDVDNIIIEHLRAIRAEVADLKENDKEILTRLARLEIGQANLLRNIAFIEETGAEHSMRYDRLKERIEKIEKQLELV